MYMRAHVLLNILNELVKNDKCDAWRPFTSFINLMIQEHEC